MQIQRATVLPGAIGFKEGNVNETYRGQILLADQSVAHAIIKDLDRKQLANELLAHALIRSLGLPTPDAYLALVRDGDLVIKHAPQLADGNHLVFATVDVKVPNITFLATAISMGGTLSKDISNWADLGNLYAFDTWVANIDRHPGNLLYGGENQIWLIDHGHCFTGPSWQVSDLDPSLEYRNKLSEWLTIYLSNEQRSSKASDAAKFSQSIALLNVHSMVDKSHLGTLISADQIAAVVSFLQTRFNNVVVQTNKALGVSRIL